MAPAHELLEAWATFDPARSPRILDGDEVLRGPESVQRTVLHRDWDAFTSDEGFGARDRRLHLSLIPQPFCGDLERARVVLLMLNPGLEPSDYFGEERVAEYRNALLATLRRERGGEEFPNAFLDPRFSWHSGFGYWHGKLAGLIDRWAAARGTTRRAALARFAQSVAVLELLPYHARRFAVPDRLVSRLRSVKLVRRYAQEVLLPRAQRGETLLVVMRQAARWGLPDGDGVLVLSAHEARGVHLTPRTRAGAAILEHLLRSPEEAHPWPP